MTKLTSRRVYVWHRCRPHSVITRLTKLTGSKLLTGCTQVRQLSGILNPRHSAFGKRATRLCRCRHAATDSRSCATYSTTDHSVFESIFKAATLNQGSYARTQCTRVNSPKTGKHCIKRKRNNYRSSFFNKLYNRLANLFYSPRNFSNSLLYSTTYFSKEKLRQARVWVDRV